MEYFDVEALEQRKAILEADLAVQTRKRDEVAGMLAEARGNMPNGTSRISHRVDRRGAGSGGS